MITINENIPETAQEKEEAVSETNEQPSELNDETPAVSDETKEDEKEELQAEAKNELELVIDSGEDFEEEAGEENFLDSEDFVGGDELYSEYGISASEPKDKEKQKKIIIISSIVGGAVLVIAVVLLMLSKLWQTGSVAMPSFLAKKGFLQGESFRYMDGITVEGVDISGLSLEEAKNKLAETESDKIVNFTINIISDDKTKTITQDDFKYTFNTEEVLNEAKRYCVEIMSGERVKEDKDFTIGAKIEDEAINTVVDGISSEFSISPVNAHLTGYENGTALCSSESSGRELNKEEMFTAISECINSGNSETDITAKFTAVAPSVTAAQIKENTVLLASFTTTSTNNANGNSNMKLALQKCDNSVVRSGEVWSFNGKTGNSNLPSAGWKEATVISGGSYQQGYGGGICQASTTIYNAALYAGLEITERHAHLWRSSYAEAGFDATIDYPGLDFKFKNNTGHDICMRCYMEGVRLKVFIYGYKTGEFDKIQLSSTTYDYVAGDHFRVKAVRTFLKDGNVIRTENLPESKYSLKSATPTSSSETTHSSEPESETPTESEESTPTQSEESTPPESEESTPPESEESTPPESEEGTSTE